MLFAWECYYIDEKIDRYRYSNCNFSETSGSFPQSMPQASGFFLKSTVSCKNREFHALRVNPGCFRIAKTLLNLKQFENESSMLTLLQTSVFPWRFQSTVFLLWWPIRLNSNWFCSLRLISRRPDCQKVKLVVTFGHNHHQTSSASTASFFQRMCPPTDF